MGNRIEAWLRARDASRFQSDMDKSARSVRKVGDAADHTGQASTRMSRAGESAASVLGAIGRASVVVGGALGLAGVAGVKFGLGFNASMEQNTVAFTNFLGSTTKAKQYLAELYQVAAHTPFEFPQLVSGARRLLAFGFQAKEAKGILTEIGDTVSGLGGGGAEIDRLVMAMGQIQAKGKLSTEELLQMAELGVPAFQIMRKQMGMTGDELETALRTGSIGAGKAIGALRKGMRDHFKGMSADQAKTFSGQFSTMKDNMAQGIGKLTEPLFNHLKDSVLPAVNKALPGIVKGAKGTMQGLIAGASGKQAAGPMTKAKSIGQDVGGFLKDGFNVASDVVSQFMEAIKPMAPFFDNILLPLLKGVGIGVLGGIVAGFKVAIPIIKVIATILGWLGEKAKPLKPVFQSIGMVIGFLITGPVLKGIALLGKFGGVFKIVAAAARVAAVPFRLVAGAVGLLLRAYIKVVGFIVGKVFGVFNAMRGRIGAAAGIFRFFATVAWNAISKGIGKVLNFLGSLGGKFMSAGKKIWTWIVDGLKAALGAGIGFAADLGKAVARAVIGLLNDAIPNSLPVPGPIGDIGLPANPIPMLAKGGDIVRSGWSLVGEEGPELAYFNSGSSVVPNMRGAKVSSGTRHAKAPPIDVAALRGDAGGERTTIAKVYLDKRQIAEAVAEDTDDRIARR